VTLTRERFYSSYEVVTLTRLTYRQIDYMARTGYLHPTTPAAGSGTQRRYSAADVDKLKLTKKLLDAGVSWRRLRRDRDPYKTARAVFDALDVLRVPA
jgi:DNA-binding transcriptional MerR regulator